MCFGVGLELWTEGRCCNLDNSDLIGEKDGLDRNQLREIERRIMQSREWDSNRKAWPPLPHGT